MLHDAIEATGHEITFPADDGFTVMEAEEASGLFFEGVEIGEELAESELPKIYKNEIGGLKINRVKSFATPKLEKDYFNARGIFKLEF